MISRIFIPLNQFTKRLKSKLWHLEASESMEDLAIRNILVFQNMIYSGDDIIDSEYIEHGDADFSKNNISPVNISIPVLDGNLYIVTGYKERSIFGISSLIDTLYTLDEILKFSSIPVDIRNIRDKLEYLCNIGLTYKAFKMINTFIDRRSFKTIGNFKAEMKSNDYTEFENKLTYYYKSNIEKVMTKYNVKYNNIYLNSKLFFLCFYIAVKINDKVDFIHIDTKRRPIKIKDNAFFDKYYRGISFIRINKNGG